MPQTNVTIDRDANAPHIIVLRIDTTLAPIGVSATGKNINIAKLTAPERVPGMSQVSISGLVIYRAPETDAERALCAAQAGSDKGVKALKAAADRKASKAK